MEISDFVKKYKSIASKKPVQPSLLEDRFYPKWNDHYTSSMRYYQDLAAWVSECLKVKEEYREYIFREFGWGKDVLSMARHVFDTAWDKGCAAENAGGDLFYTVYHVCKNDQTLTILRENYLKQKQKTIEIDKKKAPEPVIFLVKPLENGNGGWYGHEVVTAFPKSQLENVLEKNPVKEYLGGHDSPLMLCGTPNTNNRLYYWDSDEEQWNKYD